MAIWRYFSDFEIGNITKFHNDLANILKAAIENMKGLFHSPQAK